MKALLLDSTWKPITFIKEKRAIVMVMMGKAEVVTGWEGKYLRSASQDHNSPAVIRLPRYVHRYFGTPRFRRSVLYSRDGWQCQYCGVKMQAGNLTIDHVVPRARGGKTSWNNCVTACRSCNRLKGCLSPKEAGMQLKKQPGPPSHSHFWDVRNKLDDESWHPTWADFIGAKNG